MLTTILNTLKLISTSLQVLIKEPVFLVLGALWSLALVAWLGTLGLALEAGGTIDRIADRGNVQIIDFVFLVFAHLVACFITLYFQAASVIAAYHRLEGAYGSLGEGIEAAGVRLGAIFTWAAFAGTIGFVLKRFRKNASLDQTGGIIRGWSRAAPLVVPVMMIEGSPPLASLHRADELFFETWGSRTVPKISFRLAYALVVIPAALAAGGLYALTQAIVPAVALASILILIGATAVRASEAIFAVDLYAFATSGDGAIYPRRMLQQAFVSREGRLPPAPPSDYEGWRGGLSRP